MSSNESPTIRLHLTAAQLAWFDIAVLAETCVASRSTALRPWFAVTLSHTAARTVLDRCALVEREAGVGLPLVAKQMARSVSSEIEDAYFA